MTEPWSYQGAEIYDVRVAEVDMPERPEIQSILHVDLYGGPGPCCSFVRIANPTVGAYGVVHTWMLDKRPVDVVVSGEHVEITLHTPGAATP